MKLTSHAYLIEGDPHEGLMYVEKLLQEEGIVRVSNPDFYVLDFETLSIDEARNITQIASTKPFGKKKIIVITTHFMGKEAQNALLKTLEDPIPNLHFFLIMKNTSSLLSTVRSRLMTLSLKKKKEKAEVKVLQFIKGDFEERQKILQSFLSHESETKKSDLLSFLEKIEEVLASEIKNKEVQKGLEELLELKQYLFDRSPSVKMIGDYIALRLPQTK